MARTSQVLRQGSNASDAVPFGHRILQLNCYLCVWTVPYNVLTLRSTCTRQSAAVPFLPRIADSCDMPVRLPSIDELRKAWKENPDAFLVGAVFGIAAGYLVFWLVQSALVARAEFAKDQAVADVRKLEVENGDLKAKLYSTEKRVTIASEEVAALSTSQDERTKKLLDEKDESYKSLLAKYDDQRIVNADLKKRYDELAARAKDTKAPSERSPVTAAKKEVDRLSAQVRDYKAELDRLRRAPPTPSPTPAPPPGPAPKNAIRDSDGRMTVLVGFYNRNNCVSSWLHRRRSQDECGYGRIPRRWAD